MDGPGFEVGSAVGDGNRRAGEELGGPRVIRYHKSGANGKGKSKGF